MRPVFRLIRNIIKSIVPVRHKKIETISFEPKESKGYHYKETNLCFIRRVQRRRMRNDMRWQTLKAQGVR